METLSTNTAAFATRFPALVERLYADANAAVAGNGIENTVRMQFAAMGTQTSAFKRETFRALLLTLFEKRCYGILRNPAYIDVLGNISAFGNKTARPIEAWVKDSLTADGQLASLIRHLFAKYDVPAFMEYVFAENSKIHMMWYVQLSRGDSVQQLCAFPAVFTKKMAHAFRETPYTVTIEQAIRRAQAIGFGADAAMVENITWSAAFDEIPDAAFRAKVICFIAKNAAQDANIAVLQQVIEYVAEMYRQGDSYNLKGRTWMSVSRMAADFAVEKAKRLEAEARNGWVPAGIGNYEAVEGNIIYRLVQLVNSEELYEEGYAMSHCVADYAYDCAEGSSAIFSLRKFTHGADDFDTLATLEVKPETRALLEAKARFNDCVSYEAEMHIMAWAKAQDLAVQCELYVYSYEATQYEAYAAATAAQPAAQSIAEMPRVVPRAAPFEPYQPYRPAVGYKETGSDIDTAGIIKIILLVIKMLWLISRCS